MGEVTVGGGRRIKCIRFADDMALLAEEKTLLKGYATGEQFEEEQFSFRKGKGTRHANGLLRTIGERYLKNKEVYVVFVDLEKAFDRVHWNKLIGIIKKIGVDWKERRLQ
ncbi:hypothetical protein ANN_21314 [Periplaneta americana]|uniref:Reverse transcriptase domain-containing protein n=1 Tax=Periplaneta americana TaxID=6978 RepID=A0ABQ8SFW1_PERAM|nr:hypothetical protein ANN_21314 [Periplaneta americana]